MKKCKTCQELKPVSAFGPYRAAADRLYYSCRACVAAERREWRQKNKKQLNLWAKRRRRRLRPRIQRQQKAAMGRYYSGLRGMLRRDAAYAWKRLRYQYNTEFRQSILDHAKVYYENKATRRKLLRAVHRFEIRKQKNIITISDIQGASTKDFKGMVDSIIKGDAAYQPMAS